MWSFRSFTSIKYRGFDCSSCWLSHLCFGSVHAKWLSAASRSLLMIIFHACLQESWKAIFLCTIGNGYKLQACCPAVEHVTLFMIIHAWLFSSLLYRRRVGFFNASRIPPTSVLSLFGLFIYCLTKCGKKGSWEKMLHDGEESAVWVLLATEFIVALTVGSVNAEVQQKFQRGF